MNKPRRMYEVRIPATVVLHEYASSPEEAKARALIELYPDSNYHHPFTFVVDESADISAEESK